MPDCVDQPGCMQYWIDLLREQHLLYVLSYLCLLREGTHTHCNNQAPSTPSQLFITSCVHPLTHTLSKHHIMIAHYNAMNNTSMIFVELKMAESIQSSSMIICKMPD